CANRPVLGFYYIDYW
nr:immunoglobulin heavy chain junction region [Macaca mulatta]MOW86527.1 immunoglobulin heavy chain junction region [Macaca mulatta]MOW86544.1 immunoglobulin heavy chain junction region [Macaca mulatta]MOW86582.1 immunoglobulin heavy chain junction region [Macaca mulatta]MOW86659.1 immunoglobulin heavy chain junction region [Macaca mulatta]